MAGGGGKGGGGASGKGHNQATPAQIADLRKLLSGLEATNASVVRYRGLTDDRMLHRFITARNGNVDVALKMLLEHLDWRESYKLDTILDEDLSGAGVSDEFYWSGFDREGRPCLVFRACEHKKSDPDGASPTAEEKVRYYCQLLERGFRDFAPAHKFCLVLDCRGAGTNVMDRKLFKVATPIIENNFPETQHATYVLPCNGMVTMAWKVISSFIDPGTADKIRLVKDFDDQALVEAFTPETLKAFITLNPFLAAPQPYVAPDPLANPPPPSKSLDSVVGNGVLGHNNAHDHSSLPSSGLSKSEGTATLAAATAVPGSGPAGGAGSGGDGDGDDSSALLPPPSPGGSSTRLLPQQPRPSAASLAAANAIPGGGDGGGGDDDDSSVLLPPPSPGGSTLLGVNAGPSPSGSQMPPFPERPEDGVQPKLSPAGAAAAAAAAAAGAPPPSPSGSNTGQHQAAPPSPAGDSLYAISTAGGTEGGVDGGGGGPKGNSFGGGASAPTAAAAPSREETAKGVEAGARPTATAVRGRTAAAAGGLGEDTPPTASRTVEFTERTGVLYKRRDTLRGRFAYRQKYAVLRFPPPPEAASLASRRRASNAGMASMPPPPPTLTLLKGRGQTETEKVMSLEGAEVTLGTAMAGNLYPFVISFSAPRRPTPTRKEEQQQQPPPQRPALPPRRNTEDFVFTGVLDASASSSVAASDAAGGGDYRQQSALNHAAVGGSSNRGEARGRNGMPPPPPPGVHSASASRLTSPYLQRRPSNANSNASSSSSMLTGGRTRSDSFGPTGQRKTLHLGCDTEEQTLQWARWLADAVALHEAASEATAAKIAGDAGGEVPWEEAERRKMVAAAMAVGARGVPKGLGAGARAAAAATNGERAAGGGGGGGSRTVFDKKTGALEQEDAELSYRAKYNEALDALAAASGSLPAPAQAGRASANGAEGPPPGTGKAGIVRTRDGGGVGVSAGPGGGAPTGKKLRYILDSYRRSNPNGSIQEAAFSPGKAPPLPPRKNSLRSTFAKRRSSSRSFLGRSKTDNSGSSSTTTPNKSTAASSFSSSSSAAAGAVLKGLGEAGGALMSMRDSEISRLRRAYARSELSREEMKRCLRALAVQLREGEDRTGALLTDREAVLYEISAKETKLAKKEALLQEDQARAAAETQQKEELVSSLQVENQALQAAVERLRHDFQEERTLRLKREKKSGSAAAAAAANQTAPPSTPARGDGDESGRLGIMGRRRLSSRNSLPATASAAGTAARHPKTPTRSSGILSGPGVHNHNVRSTPHRARSSGGVGAAAEAAAAAAAVAAGWESNHGGIGSRHSVPTMSLVESWTVANEEGEGLPWILNTDQTWEGAARPPHEVLAHLLDELEDIMAAADSPDCATTPLVTPPEEGNGGGLTGEKPVDGGGSQEGEKGRGGKGFVADTEAFIQWSRRTGELQKVPPLESVDLPGEKEFTEGCLKLLSAHAAAVLHKEPDKLTAREEARMAYAIGDGMYTVSRLSNHLDALVAGLPTE